MSKETFSEDYKKFQVKIHKFVVEQNFADKVKQYTEYFDQMASLSPDDLKEFIQKSPTFLKARNQSMELMERIVATHHGLEEIFKMDEETLGKAYNYDLSKVDEKIAKDLKDAANMIYQFNIVSEQGRKEVEKINNPFLNQVL